MKKFIIVAAILLLAAPAWALDVECSADGCDVTVFFSGAGGENPVRGMAFDIEVDGDGAISDVVCLSAAYGYQIFPGDIDIDGSGNVSSWGSCKCSGSYPGTLDAANGMTIEMGSLYEDGVDPDPCDAGDLVSFRVSGTGLIHVSITENEIRGGCVLEDATTTTAGITECDVLISIPYCTDIVLECGGHDNGDVNCDGGVNFIDLGLLKVAFFSTKGMPNYNCCADFNDDDGCNFIDLGIMKANFFSSGHTPATGEQDCPP
jgi:hypothetical protein